MAGAFSPSVFVSLALLYFSMIYMRDAQSELGHRATRKTTMLANAAKANAAAAAEKPATASRSDADDEFADDFDDDEGEEVAFDDDESEFDDDKEDEESADPKPAKKRKPAKKPVKKDEDDDDFEDFEDDDDDEEVAEDVDGEFGDPEFDDPDFGDDDAPRRAAPRRADPSAARRRKMSRKAGPPRQVLIQLCSNAAYSKNFAQLKEFMEGAYPELHGTVKSSIYPVHPAKALVGQVAGGLQTGGIVFLFFGDKLFSMMGLPVPALMTTIKDNKWMAIAAMFAFNAFAQNLVTTGAFEVHLDGQRIFSKLTSGRMPSSDELVTLLEAQGLTKAY